jgi:hypothetical protein
MFHDTFFTEGISEDTGEKILAAMVCRLKKE